MNRKTKSIAIAALLCCTVGAIAQQPNPTSAPDEATAKLGEEFLKWKFGLFVCFNIGTFNNAEWANGYEDPATFAPDKLDCGQWADAAKAAGMKYAVLTVKHTEGYPLWDSACTTHDITAFKNYKDGKGDLVREFVDAFRKRGIKVGLYYCAPGNYDGKFGNTLPPGKPSLHGMPPEAEGDHAGFMKKQFTELLTNYGPINLIWCDQYNLLPSDQWQDIKAHIKKLQPNCLVIGNNSHKFTETDIHSYEYPIYKNDQGYPPVGNTIPAEVCDTITTNGTWFWQTDSEQKMRSAEEVAKVVRICNERNANYLLSIAPDRSGLIPEACVKRMKEIAGLIACGRKLTAVPLSHVRLLAGDFKQRQELHQKVLLGYDVDRLLYNFRLNAGLPSGAKPYGGWEAPGCGLRGHFTGHYLSACALMYAATGDAEFKELADNLVAGLAGCQEALGDGYLSAFPASVFDVLETYGNAGVWAPYYTIHKIMAGLIDAYEQTGNKQALSVATRLADYFSRRIAKLNPETIDKMTRTDYTGNPVNEFGGFAESLLALYRITGERCHLDLAQVFMREWFIAPLVAGVDKLAKMHANTHIPQATSLALAAEMTGDERLLDAADHFWQMVTQHHSFAFGGNAFDEKFKAPGVEAADLTDLSGETCNTYNMLKLTRVLFEQRPDCASADYYENALYNHILASIAPDSGCTTYHVSAKPGHFKVYGAPDVTMWCCIGTGIENTARYNEGIYYTGANSLLVNLYIPSTVELPSRGIRLKQETKFPAGDRVVFTVECKQPTDFALLLRLPGWLAKPAEVSVNGKPLPAETIPAAGHYLKIQRSWNDGDRVELRLPMELRVRPAMDNPKVVSFFYGPVLLAGELGAAGMPASGLATTQNQFSGWPPVPPPDLASYEPGSFRAVADKPLAFTQATAAGSNGAATIRFIPFYELHHERYAIYWKKN